MKNFRVLSILTLLILLVVVMSSNLLAPRKSVRGKSMSMPLADDPTLEQALAEDLALADARVQEYIRGDRSEVFGVRTVGDHYPASSAACASADCRQVEIYNFDENAAVIAIVNVDQSEVLDVFYQPNTHPGINKRLANLATSIALNHPDVLNALGFRPTEVSMAPVDGGLIDSACVDHLCVAPTFELGDRNLWAIVDLTDEKLLRVAWTDLAPNMPNGSVHYTAPEGCTTPGQVTQLGWSVQYEVTGTDGLRVYNASFNGIPTLTSVKLVEWHAAYANNSWGFEDYTGCGGGGGGFPISPYGDTQVLNLYDNANNVIGFEVVQDFRMGNWGYNCNYRYEQHIQFYADGRFRVVAGAFGRDCGSGTAIYRPLVRIDVAVNGDDNDTLAAWNGSDWTTRTTEFWELQGAPYTTEGYRWRVTDQGGSGYYIEPGQGQFGDGGLGDNAYFYVVAHHASEGDSDLPIIGDCCATGGDYQQGPHQYLTGESIDNTNIVIWYVPQSQANSTPDQEYCWTITGEPNPETYPCFAGPMFVPTNMQPSAPTASFVHNGPVMVGQTAVFTNTTTGTPPITYTWDFGDNSPTSSDVNPTHIYTDTGVYTVTLQAANDVGTNSAAQTISVDAGQPLPASFIHNGPVAIGQTAVFTNTSATFIGIPSTTYTWDFGDGTNATGINATHVYTATGAYTVTLHATDGVGSGTAASSIDVGLLVTDLIPGTPGSLLYTADDGSVISLTFPSSTVTETITLLFNVRETAVPPSGMAFAGHAFSLDAYRQGVHLPGYTFAAPFTALLTYQDSDVAGMMEETLTLMVQSGDQWLDAAATCTPASTYTRDLAQNQLSMDICHLSEFALFASNEGFLYLPLVLKPTP